MGVELNTSMGVAMSSLFEDVAGFKYGLDVKWRYRSLSLGLDLYRCDSVFGPGSENANVAAFTAGVKF